MEKAKVYEVQIYYTGFCTYRIEAPNQEEAILQARNIPINGNDILSNIENWEEADLAIELQSR